MQTAVSHELTADLRIYMAIKTCKSPRKPPLRPFDFGERICRYGK